MSGYGAGDVKTANSTITFYHPEEKIVFILFTYINFVSCISHQKFLIKSFRAEKGYDNTNVGLDVIWKLLSILKKDPLSDQHTIIERGN